MTTIASPFDYNEPLPDLHIRQSRSWEPAARHYRDLAEEDRAQSGDVLTDGCGSKEER